MVCSDKTAAVVGSAELTFQSMQIQISRFMFHTRGNPACRPIFPFPSHELLIKVKCRSYRPNSVTVTDIILVVFE